MLKKAFFLTTALVLCGSTSFAEQEIGNLGRKERGVTFKSFDKHDANAQFLSWYGGSPMAGVKYHFPPRNGSTVLYQQSASSGFSTYAVSSNDYTDSGYCCTGTVAADDFIIPGTGTHQITAVYAPGVNASGYDPQSMTVTFYDKVKYSKKTGITTVALKANCPYMPFSDLSGKGSMLVDVSSCKLGKFKGGHDYAVSVQADSGSSYRYVAWEWQTNRNRIKRQAFYFTYAWSGPCTTQFTPIKTCFPGTGYGPDLAFAIYGD